jgi:dual-specificity kinase
LDRDVYISCIRLFCFCIVHTDAKLSIRCFRIDRIYRILGQGTFGRVVHAWDKKENADVAIKIIRAIQKYLEASYAEIGVLNAIKENDPCNDL